MTGSRAEAIGTTPWYDALRRRDAPSFRQAREAAYGPGQFVDQDGFATANQILALARAAGVGPAAHVLDLCCGSGGPALYLTRETGCRLVGLDLSREGVTRAREVAAADGLADRAAFLVGDAAALPLATRFDAAPFDAALVLETMLAIENKPALLAEIARLLGRGGRLGLTLEEGRPLSAEERRSVPAGDSVWLVDEPAFLDLARSAGFKPRWRDDQTATHAGVAERLATRLSGPAVADEIGPAAAGLAAAHAQWARWLHDGRVRKLALVLERDA